MKIINEWIEKLKKQKSTLQSFLEQDCEVKIEDITQKRETPFSPLLRASSLKDLRMACIMDKFTLDSYKPECNLVEITPDDWKSVIDSFKPEIIFIESAWQGKNGSWYRKIANGSPELYKMTTYCHELNIPVVFWNKEDPIYTDTFMPAALCADFVFTTDIDCIKKYKTTLGHNNVFFLHFAAQPKLHNPIEKYPRKDKFCFAGAYYHRYPQRAKTFDQFADYFLCNEGLDIFDRNYNNPRPEFIFPDKYTENILGTLDSSEIDIAYKGYYYGINMNSVEQSQTMFARRVFEMIASNTVTIGNYSRGIKNIFGDLTISTNDLTTLKNELNAKCKNAKSLHKYRLLSLRKVLQEHLYEDRLSYIVEKVFGSNIGQNPPKIALIASPTQMELENVIKNFNRQTYPNKTLILIGNFPHIHSNNIMVFDPIQSENTYINEFSSYDYWGVLDGKNYYGKNYLLDLALTLRYNHSQGIGKGSYYIFENNTYSLINEQSIYNYVIELKVDRSIFAKKILKDLSLNSFFNLTCIHDQNLFAIDELQFCENYSGDTCYEVDDMFIPDQGISVKEIELAAEKILPDITSEKAYKINYNDLNKLCQKCNEKDISLSSSNGSLKIESKYDKQEPKYIYLDIFFEIEKFVDNDCINLHFCGKGDLDLIGVCVFYNSQKSKLNSVFPKLNVFSSIPTPEKSVFFRLGFRIKGTGSCFINEIILNGDKPTQYLSSFLSRSNVLILTNHYPSSEELYKNMFVHKRILAYKEEGYLCDIMRMNINAKNVFREFEGINIVEGQYDCLESILENGNINTVCVHFMDQHMWNVLKQYVSSLKIIIWNHGADIQPWWRRTYLYLNDIDLENAKKESSKRQNLWNDIFENINIYNMHLVIVSQQFANEIFEDYKTALTNDKFSIIHNYIDSDLFQYVQKDPEQRRKILSIRPFASRQYANDLVVKCIEYLSQTPIFDKLEFRIVGNGIYFDDITCPLRKYKNVILEKRFLRQEEIAEYHKKYGIFLAPTRMDTQGVSRDEAMSSGLVPITSNVYSVYEFVDNSCGILAEGENYIQLAEGINKLYQNPDLFLLMSRNAAERVRNQSSKIKTILREIQLIFNPKQKE